MSHGFKVAIGTLTSTLLMEFIMETPVEAARKLAKPGISRAEREAEVNELLKRGCYGDGAYKVAMEKFLEGAKLAERREAIFSAWENLRTRLRRQLIGFEELRKMFRVAGCPTSPEEIALTTEQYLHGYRAAQLIRKRYTVLDLLYEAGLFDAAGKKLADCRW